MDRSDGQQYFPGREDILADDWELEIISAKVSLNEYKAACQRVYGQYPLGAYEVAKIIGLE